MEYAMQQSASEVLDEFVTLRYTTGEFVSADRAADFKTRDLSEAMRCVSGPEALRLRVALCPRKLKVVRVRLTLDTVLP